MSAPAGAGRDQVVVVVASLAAVAAELVAGFGDIGATAVALDAGQDLAAALAAETERHGPIDLVVCAIADPAATSPRGLVETDEAAWAARAEAPLLATLHCFQGAFGAVRRPGGAIAVLLPTLAMHGAAGLVAWATAAEGQRSLAKATARQWGRHGIRVNCVAVPGELLAAAGEPPAPGEGSGRLDRPGLPPPAFGCLPSLRREVVGALNALGDERASLTGATVAVDGGVWMTP